MTNVILPVMYMLCIKHYFVDYVLQMPIITNNACLSCRSGGAFHAIQHGVLSLIILMIFFGIDHVIIYYVAFGEIIIHYIIDWLQVHKFNVANSVNIKPDEKNLISGFDDMLHYLTYIFMIQICVSF